MNQANFVAFVATGPFAETPFLGIVRTWRCFVQCALCGSGAAHEGETRSVPV